MREEKGTFSLTVVMGVMPNDMKRNGINNNKDNIHTMTNADFTVYKCKILKLL